MTFEIEAGGRTRIVEIHRGPEGYRVTVDGREHTVSLARGGGSMWSLLVGLRSYDVAVLNGVGGQATVSVNGQAVPVTISGRGGAGRARGSAGESAGGPQPILAPMPGRIVKVLVKPGDAVTARQGVVVVEAMKMENELRSPRAGTVAEVRVTEGMPVDANAVLVVVN